MPSTTTPNPRTAARLERAAEAARAAEVRDLAGVQRDATVTTGGLVRVEGALPAHVARPELLAPFVDLPEVARHAEIAGRYLEKSADLAGHTAARRVAEESDRAALAAAMAAQAPDPGPAAVTAHDATHRDLVRAVGGLRDATMIAHADAVAAVLAAAPDIEATCESEAAEARESLLEGLTRVQAATETLDTIRARRAALRAYEDKGVRLERLPIRTAGVTVLVESPTYAGRELKPRDVIARLAAYSAETPPRPTDPNAVVLEVQPDRPRRRPGLFRVPA